MQPRIVIAGTHSGAGKTTLTTGVLRALYNRGLKVQPFKSGPDYIDPAFHTFVAGRKSRNLDVWMLGEAKVRQLFAKNAADADISVIEGVMGLYDGLGTKKDSGSTAHLSKVLDAPVILVVDARGMSASAAAMVTGYVKYDEDVRISGVILNNIHGDKHYNLLREAIERDTDIPCVGYLNTNKAISLESRHLGLVPSVEVEALGEKLDEVGRMVAETVDIDKILEIAHGAKSFEETYVQAEPVVERPVKIAIAKDSAFNFYYQDALDLLEEYGAELVYFSPVSDESIPQGVSGIFLGGGFPEVFGAAIESNRQMREAIKSAIESGMPVYAECGGLMYLCDSIEDLEGKVFEMCKIFPYPSKMTKRLQRFGYVDVALEQGTVLSEEAEHVHAHEFHRSLVEHDGAWTFKYQVNRAREGETHKVWQCGLQYKNCLAAYAHIHFHANPNLAKNFVKSCSRYQEGKEI